MAKKCGSVVTIFRQSVWQLIDGLFKQRNILFYQFAGKVILVNKIIFLLLCSGAFRAQFFVIVTKLCIVGARSGAVG